MIQTRLGKQVHHAAGGAGFSVVRAKHQPGDARMLDGAGLMKREARSNPNKALPGKKRQEREKAAADSAAAAAAAAAPAPAPAEAPAEA